jgi:hypothetical protein
MASKKRKLLEENRVFNDAWTDLYFFIDCKGKPLCLICQKTIAVQKEYNLKRHYDSEHKTKFAFLVGDLRKHEINALKSSVKNQQNVFKVQVQSNESGVRASLRVAEILAKSGRPFTDSELVKQCALVMAEEVCPEQKKKLMIFVYLPEPAPGVLKIWTIIYASNFRKRHEYLNGSL